MNKKEIQKQIEEYKSKYDERIQQLIKLISLEKNILQQHMYDLDNLKNRREEEIENYLKAKKIKV